ncbi:MAG: biotin/lipoyl-binding protein [Gemmatimonadetes bacterium]|nr:biotin/lipoyl-binding protein [Gemmatimonadota bacterium]
MKYIVQVGARRVEVVLDADGVLVDGERVRAHAADVTGSPVRLVTIGEAVHRVVARRAGSRGRYALRMDGWRFDVEALDERSRAIQDASQASAGARGPAPLLAPMPGLIVRVNVQVGDTVAPGQGLVVMEAMKMENELKAASAGTVAKVHATPGSAVEKGALLVELA